NSSPTYHWVTPYECLKREASFGDLLKTNETRYFFPCYRVLLLILLVVLPNVPSLSHVSLNSPAPFVFPLQRQLEEPSLQSLHWLMSFGHVRLLCATLIILVPTVLLLYQCQSTPLAVKTTPRL